MRPRADSSFKIGAIDIYVVSTHSLHREKGGGMYLLALHISHGLLSKGDLQYIANVGCLNPKRCREAIYGWAKGQKYPVASTF